MVIVVWLAATILTILVAITIFGGAWESFKDGRRIRNTDMAPTSKLRLRRKAREQNRRALAAFRQEQAEQAAAQFDPTAENLAKAEELRRKASGE